MHMLPNATFTVQVLKTLKMRNIQNCRSWRWKITFWRKEEQDRKGARTLFVEKEERAKMEGAKRIKAAEEKAKTEKMVENAKTENAKQMEETINVEIRTVSKEEHAISKQEDVRN